MMPDCCDFLREFPQAVEKLWKYAGELTVPFVKETLALTVASNIGKFFCLFSELGLDVKSVR